MSKKPKIEVPSSHKTSATVDMEVDELEEEDEVKEAEDDAMEVEVLEKEDTNITSSTDEINELDSEVSIELEEQDTREYVEMATGIKSFSGLWKTVGRTLTLNPIDFTHLKQTEAIPSTHDLIPNTTAPAILKNAGVKNTDDNEKATKALSRVISKPDFARMQVLGQFNLGFMITCLDDQDLYIVDQHASDEKYNFETLQQTTQIKGQRLLRYTLKLTDMYYF
jgi:DNA mismatch repair protein PMS2